MRFTGVFSRRQQARGSTVKLRVGYEFNYRFPQPTPCLLVLNVHFERVGDLVGPDHILHHHQRRYSAIAMVLAIGAADLLPHRNLCAYRPMQSSATAVKLTRPRPTPGRSLLNCCPTMRSCSYLPAGSAKVTNCSTWPGNCSARPDRVGPGFRRYAISCTIALPSVMRTPGRPVPLAKPMSNAAVSVATTPTSPSPSVARSISLPATAPATSATSVLLRHSLPAILPLGSRPIWAGDGTRLILATTCRALAACLIARGRDAADVAMVTTFGPNTLESFRVWTDEVPEGVNLNFGDLGSRRPRFRPIPEVCDREAVARIALG